MFSREEGDPCSWWDMGLRTGPAFSNGKSSIFKCCWRGKGNGRLWGRRSRAQVLGVIGFAQEGEERRECSLLVDVAARGGGSCFGVAGFLCGVGERVRC